VYTETGIADLNAAQDHLASSLTGGLYIQADKPTRLSTSEAGLVKAEGGESLLFAYIWEATDVIGSGWVRIKRRRHLDY